MQELVDFLIEERYCNSELEAIKILESVSDGFYEYLIEAQISAIDATSKARKEMDAEMRKAASSTFNPKKVSHLRKKITGLKGPVAVELAQRSGSKSSQKTPTGPRGERAQTSDIATTRTAASRTDRPMTGSRLNDPRFAAAAEREVSRQTNTSPEVDRAGFASRQSTGVRRTGKYTSMSAGRATSALPNLGQSRTGARFPRQRG